MEDEEKLKCGEQRAREVHVVKGEMISCLLHEGLDNYKLISLTSGVNYMVSEARS
jgi:hypothetical protein